MAPKSSTFAKRLRALLDIRRMSQVELSRRSGVSESSISRYLKGAWEAKQDAVFAIARAADVSEAWLMGYDVQMEPEISLPSNVEVLREMDQIPLIGTIACGKPIFAEENIEGNADLPLHIRADFALTCRGDSMTGAGIYDGDVVYIRQQPEVRSGQIAAVLIDDEATLKRVYQNGDTLILQPENPAYSPMIYAGREIEEVRILGLAVGFTHSLIPHK